MRPVERVTLATTAPSRGGVWRHLEDLGKGLQRAGLDVTIGLLPGATPLQRAASEAGLRWRPLVSTLGRDSDIWHIHLHDTYDPVALLALAARRPFGPSIVTEHLPRSHASDPSLAPYFRRRRGAHQAKTAFKRAEYRLSTGVIAVGAGSARFLVRRYGIPPMRVTTIRNGVEIRTATSGPRRPDGQLRVLALGSLGFQKGFDVLLDSVRLSTRDWRVEIVGSGHQLENLTAAASSLPPGRVVFKGWSDEPYRHVEAADVVCMPSRWESFPYAALEASLLSRPLVASRVDGLDEIVQDGETGLLVDPESPTQLATALDRLAADPELVVRMGTAARRRAEQYPLADMIAATQALYNATSRRRRVVRRT